mgnify:FL=1
MDITSEFNFHSENISFTLRRKPAIISWLSFSIKSENKIPGEISYIFCSDHYLNEINVTHLQHDTLTDIITFDYCEDCTIHGDIFISIDRIKENAKLFDTSIENELHRVMIHGVLHLCSYKDKTPEDQNVMSAKEDFYLNLRDFK